MRSETQTVTVDICTESFDENGMPIFTPTGETREVTVTDLYADAGKIFACASDGVKITDHITLGTADAVENYVEVSDE